MDLLDPLRLPRKGERGRRVDVVAFGVIAGTRKHYH